MRLDMKLCLVFLSITYLGSFVESEGSGDFCSSSGDCAGIQICEYGKCNCPSSFQWSDGRCAVFTKDLVETATAITGVLLAVAIIVPIVILICCAVCLYFICRRKRQSQPGVVYAPAPQAGQPQPMQMGRA